MIAWFLSGVARRLAPYIIAAVLVAGIVFEHHRARAANARADEATSRATMLSAYIVRAASVEAEHLRTVADLQAQHDQAIAALSRVPKSACLDASLPADVVRLFDDARPAAAPGAVKPAAKARH